MALTPGRRVLDDPWTETPLQLRLATCTSYKKKAKLNWSGAYIAIESPTLHVFMLMKAPGWFESALILPTCLTLARMMATRDHVSHARA